MVKIDNIIETGYNMELIQDICNRIEQVYGLDEFEIIKIDGRIFDIKPCAASCFIRVFVNDLETRLFSFNVIFGANLHSDSGNIDEFVEALQKTKEDGFIFLDTKFDFVNGIDFNSYDFDDVENETCENDIDINSADEDYLDYIATGSVDDEIIEENIDSTKFQGESIEAKSIITGTINQIRVIPLKYNDVIIAYRFKTDIGAFDMSKSAAEQYGIGSIRSDKFIPLEKVNGIYMSNTERKLHQLVPEISACEADCKKLVDAIFETNS